MALAQMYFSAPICVSEQSFFLFLFLFLLFLIYFEIGQMLRALRVPMEEARGGQSFLWPVGEKKRELAQ